MTERPERELKKREELIEQIEGFTGTLERAIYLSTESLEKILNAIRRQRE